MDQFAGISAFVVAAETSSFMEAGRLLGVSASAIGKTVARLENRLGVRLFHRNTRSMKLTAEGMLFLQCCHRILGEVEAAEQELHAMRNVPKGRLRVSLPAIGTLLLPILSDFVDRYPEVELDIDFSDRKVDLIDEGFDAAIRIGDTDDSRLMRRTLGVFRRNLVASPAYWNRVGRPKSIADLADHTCLLYRFPSSGKIEPWPIEGWESFLKDANAATFSCNSIEALFHFTCKGRGIACLPSFEVRQAIEEQTLERIAIAEADKPRSLVIIWPSSKHLAPKLRVFIDEFGSRVNIS